MNPQSTAIPGPMHTKQTFNAQSTQTAPNQPVPIHGCSTFCFKIFYQFGPKVWDCSDGPSRPHSTQTSTKHLKWEYNSSMEKILPLGVCQKLTNPESTRSLLCVERFSFSPRRPPTVGSCVFLERSFSL